MMSSNVIICRIILMPMRARHIYVLSVIICPDEPEYPKSKVETCILDINSWRIANIFKLNS